MFASVLAGRLGWHVACIHSRRLQRNNLLTGNQNYERNNDSHDHDGHNCDCPGVRAEMCDDLAGPGHSHGGDRHPDEHGECAEDATPSGSQATLIANPTAARRSTTTGTGAWEEPAPVFCGVDFGGGMSASG